jgi:hypothetical protein
MTLLALEPVGTVMVSVDGERSKLGMVVGASAPEHPVIAAKMMARMDDVKNLSPCDFRGSSNFLRVHTAPPFRLLQEPDWALPLFHID